jgi:hypothetical protein
MKNLVIGKLLVVKSGRTSGSAQMLARFPEPCCRLARLLAKELKGLRPGSPMLVSTLSMVERSLTAELGGAQALGKARHTRQGESPIRGTRSLVVPGDWSDPNLRAADTKRLDEFAELRSQRALW